MAPHWDRTELGMNSGNFVWALMSACHWSTSMAPKWGLRLMKGVQTRIDCQKSASNTPVVDLALYKITLHYITYNLTSFNYMFCLHTSRKNVMKLFRAKETISYIRFDSCISFHSRSAEHVLYLDLSAVYLWKKYWCFLSHNCLPCFHVVYNIYLVWQGRETFCIYRDFVFYC